MMGSNVTRGYGLLEKVLSKKRAKLADALIPSNYRTGRILDIGCGFFPMFLSNIQFSEKYGVDGAINESCTMQDVNLLRDDFTSKKRLQFESCYFDVITMLAVFEHMGTDDLLCLVKEIYRLLKPGGIYILTTPAPWTDFILRIFAKVRLVSPVEIAEHRAVYSHKKIAEVLQSANFLRGQIRLGYFELFMNNWAVAKKTE